MYRDKQLSERNNFNPRAPCGARPQIPFNFIRSTRISTHAPLAGRDVLVVSIGIKVFKFQPTRPLRGATESVPALATSDFLISTHAPLAGRDRGKGCTLLDSENFNPRAPCGARLQLKPQLFDFLDFNPRAPCGARRFSNDGFTIKICISTHAPLAGRDLTSSLVTGFPVLLFQPTRPLRGATPCKT